jgi:hypothetical protein
MEGGGWVFRNCGPLDCSSAAGDDVRGTRTIVYAYATSSAGRLCEFLFPFVTL